MKNNPYCRLISGMLLFCSLFSLSVPTLASDFEDIINFYNESVANGSLTGSGSGASGEARQRTLRKMIEEAGELISNGQTAEALIKLQDVIERADGFPTPPDFVEGSATEELLSRLEELQSSLEGPTANMRTHSSTGVALTGPNDRCGNEVWHLQGMPTYPESRGTFIGLKNGAADAVDATALVPEDCFPEANPDRLIATTYDSGFGDHRGWTAPSDELKNRSLRSIPVPAGNGVRAPIPLPNTGTPANPLPPTISNPTTRITLGSWLAATGEFAITCNDSTGYGTASATMANLIPYGVYTMWGLWMQTDDKTLQVPFGGLPNTIVADINGDAAWHRLLGYCPLDFAPNGSLLQYVSLVYHGDGVTYGTVPYEAFTTRVFVGVAPFPFLSTIPGGIVSFNQLGFPVYATDSPDPM